jgi:hypothetical protein|tara:strand:+ start:6464 stop:7519 length:1056 start_codon:yes stop_codon:yes gene_type:complete
MGLDLGSQGYSNGTAAAGENQIENAYYDSFRAGFEQAYQQTESKLQPYFETESQSSEFQFFDRIGEAAAMTEDTGRYAINPQSEINHERRRLGLKDYELGKYVDEKDLKRVLTDPMNAYTQALLASGKRKVDDIIIENYFGSAYVGKSGSNVVSYAVAAADEASSKITVGSISNGSSNPVSATGGDYILAGANTEGVSVGADFGTANSGLTLAKLKAMRSSMLRLESIDQDTTLNCFLTHKQLEDLLGIDEVINSDYAVRKSLAEGNVTTFMGYRFILTERLPLSAGVAGDERRIIVSTPRSLKMSVGTALKGDIWRDTSKKNIPYLYFKLCADASRMWGEVAGEIRCTET